MRLHRFDDLWHEFASLQERQLTGLEVEQSQKLGGKRVQGWLVPIDPFFGTQTLPIGWEAALGTLNPGSGLRNLKPESRCQQPKPILQQSLRPCPQRLGPHLFTSIAKGSLSHRCAALQVVQAPNPKLQTSDSTPRSPSQ